MLLSLLVFTSLFVARAPAAQDPPPGGVDAPSGPEPSAEERGPARAEPSLRVYLLGSSLFASDLDGGGRIETHRYGFEADAEVPLEGAWVFTLGLDAGATRYDLDGASSLAPGGVDTFDDLGLVQLSPGVRYAVAPDEVWFGWIDLTAARQGKVDAEDALTFGAIAGWRRFVTRDFNGSLGLFFRERLAEDDLLFPFVQFDWRFAPAWRLVLEGPALRLEREISPNLSTGLFARYEGLQYLLEDEGPFPGAVLSDELVSAGARIEWQAAQDLRLRIELGTTLGREVEVLEEDGDVLASEDVDPSLLLGIGLRVGF